MLDNYKKGRRVGLGITGLGDTLAMLNLKYDTKDSLEQCEDIFSLFQIFAYDQSSELAKERGAFEVWNWEKEKESHYIKILPEALQDKIKMYGRRNIASMTISPAGSVSLLTQTSSGVEPIFSLQYERHKKVSKEEETAGVNITKTDDDGIKWTSFKVDHPALSEWKKITGKTKIEDSPYYKCDARSISWKSRIELQGMIQSYIDHSISSTINLPESATKEEISEIYLTAWKLGCKGVTVYREGSLKDSVLTTDEKKDSPDRITETRCPKRPKILPCEIQYSSVGGNHWIFFVSFLGEKPYEVFGGLRKQLDIPLKYTTGWVVKNGKDEKGVNTYDFYMEDPTKTQLESKIIKNISKIFTPNPSSCTRTISMSLRHGVPIKIICEQLYKDYASDMFCFERALARVLKKYVGDGEKSTHRCWQCKMKTLEYRDGCVICTNCGTSGCM